MIINEKNLFLNKKKTLENFNENEFKGKFISSLKLNTEIEVINYKFKKDIKKGEIIVSFNLKKLLKNKKDITTKTPKIIKIIGFAIPKNEYENLTLEQFNSLVETKTNRITPSINKEIVKKQILASEISPKDLFFSEELENSKIVPIYSLQVDVANGSILIKYYFQAEYIDSLGVSTLIKTKTFFNN